MISHTSDEHPWFKESRASRDNAKADWYVWADAKPDGTPPNNWLSIFGGSAWQWDTRRRQYYLHNFLAEQPDLNFHNRAVQDALLETIRFWLERGVDGFRLDTINFYFHSAGLEDNPALPESERNASIAPAVNPYNFQDHLYDKSRPENVEFLRRFRALLDEYPAIAAVGEVGDAQRGLEVVAEYTAGNDRVQMCYSFDFLGPEKLSAGKVRSILETFGTVARDGWSCWALSNHDVVRHATRWGKGEAGQPRLSQGDLGAADVAARLGLPLPGRRARARRGRAALRGPAGPLRHPLLAGVQGPRRLPHADGVGARQAECRLLQGQAVVAGAGRSCAGRRSTRSKAIPASMLEHYRRFLAFRRSLPAFAKGDIEFLSADGDTLAFTRRQGNEQIVCAFNLGHGQASVDLGSDAKLSPLDGHGFEADVRDGKIRLGPYQAWFGRKA